MPCRLKWYKGVEQKDILHQRHAFLMIKDSIKGRGLGYNKGEVNGLETHLHKKQDYATLINQVSKTLANFSTAE